MSEELKPLESIGLINVYHMFILYLLKLGSGNDVPSDTTFIMVHFVSINM